RLHPARPGWGLAAGEVRPRPPPAGVFPRLARAGEVVDDGDVADIARHLGGDVGVPLVLAETVHADAAGLVVADLLRLRRLGDVVDLEAAVVVAAPLEFLERAQVVLGHAQPGGDLHPRWLAPELVGERAPRRRQLLGAAADLAHVALVIADHDVAGDARLVAVGLRILLPPRCAAPPFV